MTTYIFFNSGMHIFFFFIWETNSTSMYVKH